MNSYNIVCESKVLQEIFGTMALSLGAGTTIAWWANRQIRTLIILQQYPTPEDLYNKLIRCNNVYVKDVAQELKGMDHKTYVRWVKTKFNPKVSKGKILLTFLTLPTSAIAAAYQGTTAIANGSRTGEALVGDAIDNKNIYNK